MIQTGKNITSANDSLTKMELQVLYQTITVPGEELRSKIHQLRIISTIDKNKYRQLKTSLPYFICGTFNPAYRRTENFGYIEHFILDLDHLNDKDMKAEQLKEMLVKDPRVELMFVSPSFDGLKIMFRLSEKCYDPAKFSLFYKLFSRSLALQYNISQVVDERTSDVTRACFFSIDEKAIFNAAPEPVSMAAYINFENTLEVKEANKIFKVEQKELAPIAEDKTAISNDVFKDIRIRLNPKTRIKPDKCIYVPAELDGIMERVKAALIEHMIEVLSIENISYGKKIKVQFQIYKAEVNIFYGKKGFSVVKSPKSGTHAELCDITHHILCELLFSSPIDDLPR